VQQEYNWVQQALGDGFSVIPKPFDLTKLRPMHWDIMINARYSALRCYGEAWSWDVMTKLGTVLWDVMTKLGTVLWDVMTKLGTVLWGVMTKLGTVLWDVMTKLGTVLWGVMTKLGTVLWDVASRQTASA